MTNVQRMTCGAILWLVAAGLSAQTVQELYTQAQAAYNRQDYAVAADLYQKSIDAGAKTAAPAYNLACCHALLGRKDEAFQTLTLAFERGWRNVAHLESDSDLQGLHGDPRWKDAVAAARKNEEAYFHSVREPELARELMQRMAVDQKARTRQPIDVHEMLKVDADNTAWMKQVIEKHGWPGKTLVGLEAANAAWLLVQHADAGREFQARCLELIKAAHEQGEATGQQLAYLTDRVLVGQGKPQIYGTQFHEVAGRLQPQEIEDPEKVDERRAKMGLGTLAEYAAVMGAQPPTFAPSSAPAASAKP